jgi:hypothetical protein
LEEGGGAAESGKLRCLPILLIEKWPFWWTRILEMACREKKGRKTKICCDLWNNQARMAPFGIGFFKKKFKMEGLMGRSGGSWGCGRDHSRGAKAVHEGRAPATGPRPCDRCPRRPRSGSVGGMSLPRSPGTAGRGSPWRERQKGQDLESEKNAWRRQRPAACAVIPTSRQHNPAAAARRGWVGFAQAGLQEGETRGKGRKLKKSGKWGKCSCNPAEELYTPPHLNFFEETP